MSGKRRKKDEDDNGNGNNDVAKARSPARARQRQPTPVPPPPKSLVTLLTKNKTVLTYFTALQDNLKDDVDRWKEKTRHYKALYEDEKTKTKRLEKELEAARKDGGKVNKYNAQDDEEEDNNAVKPPAKKRRRKEHEETASPTTARAAIGGDDTQNDEGPPKEITIQKPAQQEDSLFQIHSASEDDYGNNEDASGKAIMEGQKERGREKNHKSGREANDNDDKVRESSRKEKEMGRKHLDNDKPEVPGEEKPVEDAAFEIYSSSDDDDDDDDKLNNTDTSKKKSQKAPSAKEASKVDNQKPVDDNAFGFYSSDDSDVEGNNNALPNYSDNSKKVTTKKADTNKNKQEESIDDDAFEIYSSADSDDDDDDDENKKSVGDKNTRRKTAAGKLDINNKKKDNPIKDDAFDIYSSSDSDDNENDIHAYKHIPKVAIPFWKQHQEYILSELVEAYRCLQHLGISLVEEKTPKDDNSKTDGQSEGKVVTEETTQHGTTEASTCVNGDDKRTSQQEASDGEGEEEGFSFLPDQADANALKQELIDKSKELKADRPKFDRRSNEDVVADMLFTLRGLTRVPIQFTGLPQEYQAFRIAAHWYPCGDRLPKSNEDEEKDTVDHPAYVGKVFLFRALSIMSSYCGNGSLGLNSDKWEELFDCKGMDKLVEPEWKQSINVGMFDRKGMVDHLVESLFWEISENWAVVDRSLRIKCDFLFFQEREDEEMDDADPSDNNEGGEGCTKPDLEAAASEKSLSRLSLLAERRILVQLLVNLLLFRRDSHRAFQLVCKYVLSSVPAIDLEDYPRFYPVFSLVVLEGMLLEDSDLMAQCGMKGTVEGDQSTAETDAIANDTSNQSYFGRILNHFYEDGLQHQPPKNIASTGLLCRRILSVCIHSTALIWRQRLQSFDTRITDVARIEWAAYLRLLKSQSFWLQGDTELETVDAHNDSEPKPIHDTLDEHYKASSQIVQDMVQGMEDENIADGSSKGMPCCSASYSLGLALVSTGDFKKIKSVFLRAIRQDSLKSKRGLARSFQDVCSACFTALRHLNILELETYRQNIGSFVAPALASQDSLPGVVSECLAALRQCFQSQLEVFTPTKVGGSSVVDRPTSVWTTVAAFLRCCGLVSNGEQLIETFDSLLRFDGALAVTTKAASKKPSSSCSGLNLMMESLESVLTMPSVRVINLKRRRDRMNMMMSQAMHAGVLVLKAVATLESSLLGAATGSSDAKNQVSDMDDETLYGGFAIDGKLKADDLSAQILANSTEGKGGQRLLEAYVAAKWRPINLKAFDRLANDDEKVLVRLSDSERACALSHISAWKGVLRTLTNVPAQEDMCKSSRVFQHGNSMRRLFLISGYARGLPLRQTPENDNMPPCPVCVILEDDAVLVDRFVDRLDEILEELPRDFHFCSLGYSRPKTAPIVKYSEHVGIPTCIFYLTGYILSLEGAKHLLDSLPVCGPVDTFIGLKMVKNWENEYGSIAGVGTKSTTVVEPPSRKVLSEEIMHFRAFAAMIPLCAQSVGGGGSASSAGVTENNWRQRDTDITYSGSANYVG